MTAVEIVEELKSLASDSIRKTLLRHRVAEPVLGVKVEHLKKIQKRIRKNYELSLELYDTGIYDAMYLAGLIADEKKMTKRDLEKWAKQATSQALCGSTVPWIAAESRFGWELAIKWIDSRKEAIASIGWATLSSLVAIKQDDELDIEALTSLIGRVEKEIHKAPNAVRYSMNSFLIAVGCSVTPLTKIAEDTGRRIGKLSIDVGDTDCKIASCPEYIEKVRKRGTLGKKRMTARC